ncbi:hypothetical protein [Saccharothrix sp. HUAS TT1]|uniref:hypothetical protein n=1 Tax=unclassified Saccharothrix TaxID=2593673 RepID=UPI00345B7A31
MIPNPNTGLPSHPDQTAPNPQAPDRPAPALPGIAGLPVPHPLPPLLFCDVQHPDRHGYGDAVEILLAQAVLWYGDCAAGITRLPAARTFDRDTDAGPRTDPVAKYANPATTRTRFDLFRGSHYVTSLIVLGDETFGLDQASTLAAAFPTLRFDPAGARRRGGPQQHDWPVLLDRLADAYEVDRLPDDFDQAHWVSPTALRAVADMIRTGTPVWPGDHRRGNLDPATPPAGIAVPVTEGGEQA